MRNIAIIGAFVVSLAVPWLTSCTRQVEEPWVTGNQFQSARERLPEQGQILRHRLEYTQIDR